MSGEIEDKGWAKLIWFTRSIPRHSFQAWQVYLNRCPTKDRMIGWGLHVDPMCVLCNSQLESRDHLFFDCPFSYDLWTLIASRCCRRPLRSWGQTVDQLTALVGDKAKRLLSLLAWQATIYWLWTEKNGRLHARPFTTTTVMYSVIDRQIRNKVQSFREINPSFSTTMMQRWFSTG